MLSLVSHRRILARVLLTGTAALALTAGSAQAGGFASRLGSANASAQAWAGSAAPGLGIGGISVNPAVVTALDGVNVEQGIVGILPDGRLSPATYNATSLSPAVAGLVNATANAGGTQSSNFATSLLGSGGYFNLQLSKDWYFGVSVTAPLRAWRQLRYQ